MGDFPTHSCSVTYNGEEIPTVMPLSQLDCDKPACKIRADIARERAESMTYPDVLSRAQQSRDDVAVAMNDLAFWNLTLEAQQRADAQGGM